MSDLINRCTECGMICRPGEYHPFAACLMFRGCHDANTVRANLPAIASLESHKPLSDSSATVEPVKAAGDTAGAAAAFIVYYGERGWPMERVEIAEHDYVRFTTARVDAMWMAFKTGWELSATDAPATPPDHLDVQKVADESKARKRGLESEYTRVFVSRHDNFDNLPVDRKVEFRELHWLIRELDRRLDQGRE